MKIVLFIYRAFLSLRYKIKISWAQNLKHNYEVTIENVALTLKNPESKENLEMKEKYIECLNDENLVKYFTDDISYTLEQLGLNKDLSFEIANKAIYILEKWLSNNLQLIDIENQIYDMFSSTNIGWKWLIEFFKEWQIDRSNTIFLQLMEQIEKFWISWKWLDYWIWNWLVSQNIKNELDLEMNWVDVKDYRTEWVTIPALIFDWYNVPVENWNYDFAIITNVLHHEKDNQKIINELLRCVKKWWKIIVIETVPDIEWITPELEKKWLNENEVRKIWFLRNFLNDAFFNRFITPPSVWVPVPATYETSEWWEERFKDSWFNILYSKDLGYDIKAIKDKHHIYVIEKN